jgi:hypothetical protein
LQKGGTLPFVFPDQQAVAIIPQQIPKNGPPGPGDAAACCCDSQSYTTTAAKDAMQRDRSVTFGRYDVNLLSDPGHRGQLRNVNHPRSDFH